MKSRRSYVTLNQMVYGTLPEHLIDRVLINASNPRFDGYTALCLLCLDSYGADPHEYSQVAQWAEQHRCNPARRTVVYHFLRATMRCLYCGSTDFREVLVTVDDRTTEHALMCEHCDGVWTP